MLTTLSRAADVLQISPAAIVVDLEGSLLPIGRTPDAARLALAQEALSVLSGRLALVAVITGRPAARVAALLSVPAVVCIGNQGLESEHRGVLRRRELRPEDVDIFEQACSRIRPFLRALQGVQVERTRATLRMEYRASPFPQWTRGNILRLLQPLVAAGMIVLEGRRMVELHPRGAPTKKDVVARLVREYGLQSIVYVGDDRTDLGAFALLRELRRAAGMRTLSVAVLNKEAATSVPESADVTLASPAKVVEMMHDLAAHHLHPAH